MIKELIAFVLSLPLTIKNYVNQLKLIRQMLELFSHKRMS